MKEKELKSAKMYFKHKVNIEKFKKDTFEKLERSNGNRSTILEGKRRRKRKSQKLILASVASIMILGVGYTFGGSYIADAAETFINQLFGSKENLMQAYPEESQGEIDFLERQLQTAKENLTEEEFNHYSQLLKEHTEIFSKIQKENREYPNEEEEKRLDQIQKSMGTYEAKFIPILAQELASFSFTKPTYVPKGYNQVAENYPLTNESEEPVVLFEFSNGETSFSTQQLNINQKADLEESGFFEINESYSIEGLQFDYVSSKEMWAWDGMRVTVPEKGYKLIITADGLSKGDMEKVLLSMIEK